MLRTRVIPVLLLKDLGLVKTINFKNPKYIGDPINAVRIFNEKEVDELIFLDIAATPKKRRPNFELIRDIASEAFMPFAYGGGITDINDIEKLINLGVEKVILNSILFRNLELVKISTEIFGSQSIVISLDIKETLFNGPKIFYKSGTKKASENLIDFVKKVEKLGAGEIMINSIERDGTMSGYDIQLLKSVTDNTEIPVIACGGAGKLNDLKITVREAKVSAVAAGSMFVFNGPHRAVLISYPKPEIIAELFNN